MEKAVILPKMITDISQVGVEKPKTYVHRRNHIHGLINSEDFKPDDPHRNF